MKKLLFLSALFVSAPCLYAISQWTGDVSMFDFSNDSINLSAPRQSATVFICRESEAAVNAEFSCSVKMDYTPSSVNYVKFYIMSDSPDLTGELDGYYLRIGYSDKTFALYRQEGRDVFKLASAEAGLLDSPAPDFSFRLSREGESNWTFEYRDNKAGGDYETCFSVEDDTFTRTAFTGFVVKFSSTRNEAFHFADFRVRGENGEEKAMLPFPGQGDVVLNEILFNPFPGGSDYVELFNPSVTDFELGGCGISNGKDTFALPECVIKAESYMVFTADKEQVISVYNAVDSLVMETRLPSMPDDEGNVLIITPDGIVIDSLRYNEDMHSTMIADVEGVALERCSPFSDKWVSASSFYSYGTPGYENSQYMDESEVSAEAEVSVLPLIFTPDGDGDDDYVRVCHRFDGGLVGSLCIYHSNGYVVRRIYSDCLLSAEDCALWDGTDENGVLCPLGIYVALFEAYDVDGFSTRAKIPFVLSAKR